MEDLLKITSRFRYQTDNDFCFICLVLGITKQAISLYGNFKWHLLHDCPKIKLLRITATAVWYSLHCVCCLCCVAIIQAAIWIWAFGREDLLARSSHLFTYKCNKNTFGGHWLHNHFTYSWWKKKKAINATFSTSTQLQKRPYDIFMQKRFSNYTRISLYHTSSATSTIKVISQQ